MNRMLLLLWSTKTGIFAAVTSVLLERFRRSDIAFRLLRMTRRRRVLFKKPCKVRLKWLPAWFW